MALTICGACDKSYLETKKCCPHCNRDINEQIAFRQGYLTAFRQGEDNYKNGFFAGIEHYWNVLLKKLCGRAGQ